MSALPQAVRDWLAQQPPHVVQSFMLDLASRHEGDSTTGSVNSLQDFEEPPAAEPKAMPAREPWEPPTEEGQAMFFKQTPAQPSDEETELQPAQPETKPEPPQPSPHDDAELIKAFESFNLIDLETPTGTSPEPTAIEVPKAEEVPESYVAVKAMPKPSNKLTEGAQPTRFNKQHAPPSAAALPNTEPTAPRPGEDIWWTSRPITSILSARHRGRLLESLGRQLVGPLLGDGGQQAPTRSNPVEPGALGLQPRPSLLSVRIWVHPRRAIHDQPPSMAPPQPTQPSDRVSEAPQPSDNQLGFPRTRAREEHWVRPPRTEPSQPHLQCWNRTPSLAPTPPRLLDSGGGRAFLCPTKCPGSPDVRVHR